MMEETGSAEPRVIDVETLDVMASPEDRRLKEMIKSSLFGELSAPVRIGRFTVMEQLGSGGMGVVYLARDDQLDRKVAIKLLRSDHESSDELARARLLREARAMARLSHPNVVTIHEVGSYEDQVFLAMEYLEGEDLAARLTRERRLSWAEARALTLQLCDAIAAMHELGIVHRDIKPHNIFLVTPPGRGGEGVARRPHVKVLDFGIAKLTRSDASSVRSLTATGGGELVGTAAYIAPEQARADAVDGRADIYAVGLVLYELLTGRVPFSAPTFMAVVSQHLSEPPPPPRSIAPEAELPAEAERLILRCLEKQPDDRYADVHALRAALHAIPEAPAAASLQPARPPLVLALSLLALLAVGLTLGSRLLERDAGEEPSRATVDAPAIATAPVDADEDAASARSPKQPTTPSADEPIVAPAAADASGSGAELVGAGDDAALSATPRDADDPAADKPRKLPKQLDERVMARALKRRGKQVRRCGRDNGGLPDTRFKVQFTVRPSGAVDQVTVDDPLLSPPLRRCLEGVVLRTRFPPAQGSTDGAHVFSF